MVKRFAVAASLVLALAACQDESFNRSSRHLSPIPPATMALMSSRGMSKNDPIVIRSYKKESEMEVWKRGSDGKFALLKTFPICRWSGQLGPKTKEGDRQAPEGFYAITPGQMNPNSAYYLSFDTGYPNAYDRAHGRSGAALMVHGSCSSRGCFAMTDEAIAEVYAIAREAFAGGQRTFQFQSYPFRMTPKNIAQHRLDPNIGFWKNLKEGSDYFEATGAEPKVAVCGSRYVFGSEVNDCNPVVPPAVAQKSREDDQQVADLIAGGVQPIRLVYADGGQHESFRQALGVSGRDGESLLLAARSTSSRNPGDVSRPEALAMGPQEIVLDASGRPKDAPAQTALAFASAVPAAAPPAMAAKPALAAAAPAPAAAPAAKPVSVASVQAAQAAAAAEEQPFYKRVMSRFSSLVGSDEPSPEAAPVAPGSAVPVPPRRTAPTAHHGAKPAEKRAQAAPVTANALPN
jgi:murein L,D-transpeptidase YafK